MKRPGIDISLYQKNLDFNKVKAEGFEYAIIKASERNFTDPEFENNYRKAKAAGLGVGAYHFLGSRTLDGAKKEAAYFVSVLKGKQFDYPVFLDVEGELFKGLSVANLTKLVRAFCEVVEGAGYWVGFYTNWDWYNHRLDGKSLAERFSLWLAFWDRSYPDCPAQMWQYGGSTNFIRSPEIGGVTCDQDYSFVDYPSLIKAKGLNGYGKEPTPAPTPTPTPEPKPEGFKKGDKVRMKQGAPVYGMDIPFLPFVYNEVLFVREVDGNRIVVSTNVYGAVTGAVDAKYLYKV